MYRAVPVLSPSPSPQSVLCVCVCVCVCVCPNPQPARSFSWVGRCLLVGRMRCDAMQCDAFFLVAVAGDCRHTPDRGQNPPSSSSRANRRRIAAGAGWMPSGRNEGGEAAGRSRCDLPTYIAPGLWVSGALGVVVLRCVALRCVSRYRIVCTLEILHRLQRHAFI